MAIHKVILHQEFDAPAERVWEALSDHNNFGKIMGQNMKRILDSQDPGNVNGVGSVRLISLPMLSFEETVRKSQRGSLIEYQITKGTPLDHHLGRMAFTDLPGNRSALDYTIELGSKVPLLASIVKVALENGIGSALHKYAKGLKK